MQEFFQSNNYLSFTDKGAVGFGSDEITFETISRLFEAVIPV